jgi:hypothetical protein
MLRAAQSAHAPEPADDRFVRTTRSRASPVAPRRPVLAALVMLAGASVSCGGGDGGTPPPPPPPPALTCPSAGVPLCTNTASAAAARDGTSDAATRSTPALENATARTAVATNLGQLDAAIGVGNITDARAALGRARDAITAARGQTGFPGDAPDLAAIELLLDRVAPLIGVS